MKTTLAIFLLTATLALAEEYPLDSFCIGVPDAVFITQTNAVATLTWELWHKEMPKDWCNRGWKKMWVKTDHTKIWWIYDITKKQIKDNLSAARRQELKDILSDAGVRWENLWIGAVAEKYNLEYCPDQPDEPLP
jgi:hypothetical protein